MITGLKNLFQRLFGGVETPEEETTATSHPTPDIKVAVEPQSEADTLVGEPLLATTTEAPATVPPSRYCGGSFCAGWLTDVGRVRNHNEDALFVFSGEQASDNAIPRFGLFILADGMGGHQSGEIASALAVQTAASHLIANVYEPILSRSDREGDRPSLTEVIQESIHQANQRVSQDAPGSGSTLTCGMVLGDRLFLGHVGDSRAYFFHKGEPVKQLTSDHSLVNRLVEMGQLTLEEAAVHPQRNVLYRAIGQGESLTVDVLTTSLQPGDRIMLCSDGLWGMVEEVDMWQILDNAPTVQDACANLVQAANDAGGNDNITVILVEMLGV